jgi:hypothetical protein
MPGKSKVVQQRTSSKQNVQRAAQLHQMFAVLDIHWLRIAQVKTSYRSITTQTPVLFCNSKVATVLILLKQKTSTLNQ